MRVLVTGGTGFVGRALVERLVQERVSLIAAGRHPLPGIPFCTFDLEQPNELPPEKLSAVDVVLHLAARVHVMKQAPGDAEKFHRMNVMATQALANAAARAGVRRFVYLSSVKVNGERTLDRPFSAGDQPRPEDTYGISKRDAELALREIAARSGLEVVIIRPPLVYGPGVGANFLRLMSLVRRGLPLPFGAVDNKRSLVSVWNLTDLIWHAATFSAAAGGTWMASDNDDVSTPRLLTLIGDALGVRTQLLPVPPLLLNFGARLLGLGAEMGRLTQSLQIDVTPTVRDLAWRPSISVEEGVRRTVKVYMESQRAVS